MSNLNTLLKQLKTDHPKLLFKKGERFTFRPPNTIFYCPKTEHPDLQLLHELGHYLNEDQDYTSDIALLRIESKAWATAQTLAAKYNVNWDEVFIQAKLDSYRDWLHNASLCPICQINGYQSGQNYHCPLCNKSWPRLATPDSH
jgi:hypothetical protein